MPGRFRIARERRDLSQPPQPQLLRVLPVALLPVAPPFCSLPGARATTRAVFCDRAAVAAAVAAAGAPAAAAG